MVVVKADHIVVDESALTGEATPILKTEIDPTMSKTVYDPKTHKSCTISAGTEILEVGGHGNDLGLVMTTGSFTSKGKLLTEVLSYQRHKFKFDDEVKFILVLLVIEAFILFGLVCYFLKDQFVYAWMYGTCHDPLIIVCKVHTILRISPHLFKVSLLSEQLFPPCYPLCLWYP
jgi:magnesium-transporting ATPase (P-type)